MAEFVYNNIKNTSFSYTSFKFNCGYYSRILYKEDIDSCSKSKLADELSAKLNELMIVCLKNFYHTQKFQIQAYNKIVKPRSYASSNKFWLNNKYIKIKQN